jgi:hypothetical protein
MFGLDNTIAHLSTGSSVAVVILVAALLGLATAAVADNGARCAERQGVVGPITGLRVT